MLRRLRCEWRDWWYKVYKMKMTSLDGPMYGLILKAMKDGMPSVGDKGNLKG